MFEPMVRRLQAILLAQTVIYADETPLKVIHEDKAQCYMWVYCTGTDSPNALSTTGENPNIALFDYQPSRAASCAISFLQGFTGFLQVDGYAAYHSTSATLVGCWAHARRKFKEADLAKQKNKVSKAQWALNHIQKLYRIEQKIKGKTAEEKLAVRQKESLPLLLQFKDWLDKASLQVLPKSTLGKAIQYARNQWHKLIRFVENGSLNIDNNRPEREAKAFAVGRKNWLFANTSTGAHASCIHYSLVRTAKANGLDERQYIERLLNEMCRRQAGDDIDDLLPWNIQL